MANIIPFRALKQVREPKQIKMARAGSVGEIWIYEQIGAGFFEDGITAKQFTKDLQDLGDVETLNIFINSPGGSVFEGTTIHNVLARHKAHKVVQIDGLAASIASVIAMAGDEIQIAENGMMMIHNAWAIAVGDSNEMRKIADQLDKVNEAIRATYVSRTGLKDSEVAALMDAETWMTGAEAVEKGFADSLTEPVDIAAMAKFDLSAFQNTPEELVTPPEKREPHPAVLEVNSRLEKLKAERRLRSA